MILRIPSGTRDVLPDETREVRAITEKLLAVFEGHGYGELRTPALEYELEYQSLPHPENLAEVRPAYRVFDESGAVLVLRSDMTVPIARVAATRYAHAEPPLRFCYLAHCYRGVGPRRGQPRELLQAGIELLGLAAPQGTAEALSVLCHALDATGLRDYRVGLGDAAIYPSLMASLEVPEAARPALLEALGRRDFVELGQQLSAIELSEQARELLLEAPQRRGGREVLGGEEGPLTEALAGMRELMGLLDSGVAARVICDLGLVRSIGYYTGSLFEVYDPALGAPIGGGGRYDELLGSFGRPLPAVGFALAVDRLHVALAGEERGAPRPAPVAVGAAASSGGMEREDRRPEGPES